MLLKKISLPFKNGALLVLYEGGSHTTGLGVDVSTSWLQLGSPASFAKLGPIVMGIYNFSTFLSRADH